MAPNAPAAPTPAAPEAKPAVPVPPVDPKAATAVKTDEPKHKIKVNGKEIELPLSQIIARAQRSEFADQRLKSVDVLSKTSQALIAKLKTPGGVLEILKDKNLGNSPKEVFRELLKSDIIDDETKDDLTKWVYENVVQAGKKTPEELERDKKLTDYERLKKQEAENKKKAIDAQKAETVNKLYTAVRGEVSRQLKDDKSFPQTEGSIRMVIDKLRVMNRNGAGVTTETVSKAITEVKKNHQLIQQQMLDTLGEDGEGLISFIGEPRALRIAKALTARILKKKTTDNAPKKVEGQDREESLEERNRRKFKEDRHGYRVLDVM